MNTQPHPYPTVDWPSPPFFQFLAPPRSGAECAIVGVDGGERRGQLIAFDLETETLGLRVAGRETLTWLDFAQLRSVTLTDLVSCKPDAVALDAVGVSAMRAHKERSFTLTLTDGSHVQGTSLGFNKKKAGLFMYLLENGGSQVTNCFIPGARIRDLQVGPLLGETLVRRNAVSAQTLEIALNSQSKLRQEKLGSYLEERAIITSEDLVRAIAEQSKRPNARLGEILVEAGMITPEQLKEALGVQQTDRQRRVGDILVEMGAVSLETIQVALSDKLGIPFVNVREFRIDPEVLESLDPTFAIRSQVLPLLRTRTSLIVAVANPLASDLLQDLRFQTNSAVDPVIANPKDLKERIYREYSGIEGRAAAARPGAAGSEGPNTSAGIAGAHMLVADLNSQLARDLQVGARGAKDMVLDPRVADNTLVRLVNKIILDARAQGASDIHIESSRDLPTRVRFRKDGDLEDYLELPHAYNGPIVSRLKVMAELDISEHRRPQDGRIEFGKHGPIELELRVAIIPTANGLEDVVMRIQASAEPLPLERVGFSAVDLGKLRAMISRNNGLFLVCGPTGSGKTTTLHSVLHAINRPDLKIWTAEDPVEITQPGLRQVQVHAKIDWTFAAAMRSFLRADPDVIMVGEMRDPETAKIGIEASLTGHLVLSTLHTNSAAESIIRLLDLGMDPFNFADALIGILSQRLTRKLCLACRQAYPATALELSDLADEYCNETPLDPREVLADWQSEFAIEGEIELYRAVGCGECRNGYKGRSVVYELLSATADIKHLVRSRGTVPQLVATAQSEGTVSLRQNAIRKVLLGALDLASAREVAS